MRLNEDTLFDTVYREHFSYLSLHTVSRIFGAAGLRVWHIEELQTHGGSLRIWGCHVEDARATQPSVINALREEVRCGLQQLRTYLDFQRRADKIKNDLMTFLIELQLTGKKIAAYGAAAKGNTLLNFVGVKPDLLPLVCDAATAKQGKSMMGSHIPIVPPNQLASRGLDYVLILPWNVAAEVQQRNASLKEEAVPFVTTVAELVIL